jgi:hypothetical protein
LSSSDPGLTVERVRRDDGACVLTVSGEFSLRSAGLVEREVSKALADTGRVLLDVSGLRLSWVPAVAVFPSILARAGGWPFARLVLFGAGPELARSINALRVSTTVPVAPDEAAAHRLLERRPPTVTRYTDLDRARSPLRGARLFVEAACADWRCDAIREDAVLVASELVSNAVLHAGPGCRLTIRYTALGMTVAVRDDRPDLMPPLHSIDPDRAPDRRRGHGLQAVAAASRHWGITPGQSSKTTWAYLPLTDSAGYSRAIRTAAHDAVRAALTHGVDSPDTSTAVNGLTTHLLMQYGTDAGRDLVAELARDLYKARSIIADGPGGPFPDGAAAIQGTAADVD